MLGSNFYPSQIENQIYEIMEDYILGSDTYEEGLVDAITDYFINYHPTSEWKLACAPWLNVSGGVCSVCWIEDGHVHMVMFDYKKEEK